MQKKKEWAHRPTCSLNSLPSLTRPACIAPHAPIEKEPERETLRIGCRKMSPWTFKQIDLLVTKATTEIRWPMLMTIDWHWQSFWFGYFGFGFFVVFSAAANSAWHDVKWKVSHSYSVKWVEHVDGERQGKLICSLNLPKLISIFGFLALASSQWFTILRHTHTHSHTKTVHFFCSCWLNDL